MKVGERRKVVSDPVFSLKEPLGSFAMVKSTNEEVVALDLHASIRSRSAWVVAKSPGRAVLKYYPFDMPEGTATTVHVIPKSK
jgi:hypothetical protein